MRIGVDLGGTKIEVLALDSRGHEQFRERLATPRGDYMATIQAIKTLVERADQALAVGAPDLRARVGVAMPGSISPTSGKVRNANSTVLNDRDLITDLQHALARQVRVANDANCFTLSEATDGAAATAGSTFGVILGTGCGGGLVIDRHLHPGASGNAGEWGHNGLPWPTLDEVPGPACWCGRSGCLETWLSGPGMVADFKRRGGHAARVETIVQGMRAGDDSARATFDAYVSRLARGLASVINVFDPEVIVLGGGLSQIDELYTQVPAQWATWVFTDNVKTSLRRNRHGDSSGVRGAAWLWPSAPSDSSDH